jgi:diaminopimelate epimerase
MEGIGNDYIYFDGINQKVPTTPTFIKEVSDRHFGIGSDGIIIILPSDKYDFKMRMFNNDGSEGMMCGNGIRCFSKFVFEKGLTDKKVLNIETKSGLRVVTLLFEEGKVVGATVDMGKPEINCSKIPVTFEKDTLINETIKIDETNYKLTAVSVGNPHVITYVYNLDNLDLEKIGPKFEHDKMFPQSVNTEFVEVIDDTHLKMRVWERGSGETMACGTGACAVMYASKLNGLIKDKATIQLLGGDLVVEYKDEHIFMSGPATNTFEGYINVEGDKYVK